MKNELTGKEIHHTNYTLFRALEGRQPFQTSKGPIEFISLITLGSPTIGVSYGSEIYFEMYHYEEGRYLTTVIIQSGTKKEEYSPMSLELATLVDQLFQQEEHHLILEKFLQAVS